jgi:Zn-finger nucleic acid-binding protein
MRLLVACPHCHRQYDASSRPVGSRFHCLCGHHVDVRKPPGHDAQVVRCSSCGAARTENRDICPYCQSEFTLHERDLNTVCPQCLTRVSDQARYCHFCGTGLAPEADAGTLTSLRCPMCEGRPALHSRSLGQEKIAALECERCGGLWLGHEAFQQLVERAQKEALPPVIPKKPATERPKRGRGKQGSAFYRPCVVCGELMNRVNYGHASGVILNICKNHGIWFDADALARILAWIHSGEAQKAAARAQREAAQEAARTRAEREAWRTEYEYEYPKRNLLAALLEVLFGP